jgi:hypothetical protein
MVNLEQMIENSFFDKLKIGLSRIKYSVIGKATVYSLAGILSVGLGYGCEGNECGNGDCESTDEDCNSCPDDCGNCLPEQSNNDRSNPGSNNGTNDNSGSNSGTGSYCDPCDSYLDCKEGWRCHTIGGVVGGDEFQIKYCLPPTSTECTSDSQCGGYYCFGTGLCILPSFYGCDANHNIWVGHECGDETIVAKECTGNTQCQNLNECEGNIKCSDTNTYFADYTNQDSGKYACVEVIIKGNGKLGDACNTDTDCEKDLVCGSQWPGGYCMLAKEVSSYMKEEMKTECKDIYNGAYCDSIFTTAWCVKTCTSDADCRSGYYCGLYYISYDCNENACLPINQ